MICKCEHWQVCDECRQGRFPKTEDKAMTKELLQQALVNVHDAILRGNSDGELLVMIDDALRDAKAQQEQPAQETCWCDQNNIGEPGVSCGDCPTRDYKQPALSDLIELAKVYSQQYASPHHIVFSVDGLRHLIEAHLKGQKLSDAEIRKYFDSENGLENCSMCHLDDFTKVYRAIEAHCRGGA